MSPRPRRPLLDGIWNPHGGSAAVRDLERRIQRVERAPVKFSLERVKEPKKAPQPSAPIPGASIQVIADAIGLAFGTGAVSVATPAISYLVLAHTRRASAVIAPTGGGTTWTLIDSSFEGGLWEAIYAADGPTDGTAISVGGSGVFRGLEVFSVTGVSAALSADFVTGAGSNVVLASLGDIAVAIVLTNFGADLTAEDATPAVTALPCLVLDDNTWIAYPSASVTGWTWGSVVMPWGTTLTISVGLQI